MTEDPRKNRLDQWAYEQLETRSIVMPGAEPLVSASDDASFRRYFRFQDSPHPFIFVDAPPDKEDSRPFVAIAKNLTNAGLNAPVVYAADHDQGFMMLSDLGMELYLPAIEAGGRPVSDVLYGDAVDALVIMQSIAAEVPDYNSRLLRQEMDLFPQWFLAKELGIECSGDEQNMLDAVFTAMIKNAMEQPQVFVHRDYHSRNLMVTADNNPGIIDFQDAALGPITYDLVSLMRDCYLKLPLDEVRHWVAYFRARLIEKDLIEQVDEDAFMRWFDLMGLQRHLKCAGIFSRLHLRDGKAGYLGDIPLVFEYMKEVCACYEDLAIFGDWLSEVVEQRLSAERFQRFQR